MRSCASISALLGLAVCPPIQAQSSAIDKLATVPVELHLADSSLRIVNIYKLQATVILGPKASRPPDLLDRLARDVYRPYASFWQGYLGDEARFRHWAATSLLSSDHPINARLAQVLTVGLDSLFTASSFWISKTTGRSPKGTWYVVFGPGWTNMGGFNDGSMVLDFTEQDPNQDELAWALAHELTHMAHGASPSRGNDPDAGSVMGRVVSEGLASYATYAYAAGGRSPAQSVGYTDDEWAWALAHETELRLAAKPYLDSRERADLDRFAARNQRLLESGPSAVGYFLGFRIVQAYVAKHGAISWTHLIDLPVREVVSRSGYRF